MAYSTSAPPQLISHGVGGGFKMWSYTEATAAANIDADNYITNGYHLGMKVGDIVIHIDTTTPAAPVVTMHAVATSSPLSFNLSLGTTVGSATTGD
jgi:hypothetical protein